jgi:type IX secretion system PorP/SprF family membrane protein
VPGIFNSYLASYDHYLRTAKSGVGFQLFRDEAGIGALTTMQATALYAYEVRLAKHLMGRGGFSIGTIQRRADITKYVFADQLRDGKTISSEVVNEGRSTYLDVGTGVLLYTRSAWFGFSASHINQPNQSVLNGVSPLPSELKFHGGFKFVIEELESSNPSLAMNNFVTLAANYKKQNKFNQLDLGIYYTRNLIVLGLWYRGIPLFKPEPTYQNNDALILLFGVNVQKYKIGYSYDYTLSKLTNASSKGSHEISMSYQFCTFKKTRKRKNTLVVCPKF